MRRTRKPEAAGSLELLLDTITNTFGGILFLAILVVILLRVSTPSASTIDRTPLPDLLELSGRLDSLLATRTALQAEAGAREFAEKLHDPVLAEMLRHLRLKREVRDQLEQQRAGLLQSLSTTQARTNELVEELGRLDDELKAATEELAHAEGELEREKASRQVNSPFPRERAATKRAVSILVKYNRLYEKRKRDRTGFGGAPNTEDFFVRGKEGGYLVLSPKPYRGIALIDGDRLATAAVSVFSQFRPDRYYVEVGIWDDSFSGFQLLREFLVEAGYEYRLVVATEGGEIAEGYVPTPKVQ